MVWLIRAQFDDRARNSATQGLLRRRQNTWRPDMRGGANPGGTTPTRARPRIPCRNPALAPKPALGVRVGKSGPGRVQPTLATPVLAGGAWRRRRCAGPAGEHQRLERGRRSDIKGGLSRTRVALPHGPQGPRWGSESESRAPGVCSRRWLRRFSPGEPGGGAAAQAPPVSISGWNGVVGQT